MDVKDNKAITNMVSSPTITCKVQCIYLGILRVIQELLRPSVLATRQVYLSVMADKLGGGNRLARMSKIGLFLHLELPKYSLKSFSY